MLHAPTYKLCVKDQLDASRIENESNLARDDCKNKREKIYGFWKSKKQTNEEKSSSRSKFKNKRLKNRVFKSYACVERLEPR